MSRKAGREPASPQELLDTLGVEIDGELLVLALTHRSFAHEAGGIPTNERLEFLGDAVLGVIVTEALFRRHPSSPEGDLARMRAATVSQRALAEVARTLDLGRFILLGKGETRTGGAEKDSILSDTVEAIIGAVFLSHGLERARDFVHSLVEPLLTQAARLGAGLDWKTSLQEIAAANDVGVPVYESVATGPDHARTYRTRVLFGSEEFGAGEGKSKKHAELMAAEVAYRRIAESTGEAGEGSDAGAS